MSISNQDYLENVFSQSIDPLVRDPLYLVGMT